MQTINTLPLPKGFAWMSYLNAHKKAPTIENVVYDKLKGKIRSRKAARFFLRYSKADLMDSSTNCLCVRHGVMPHSTGSSYQDWSGHWGCLKTQFLNCRDHICTLNIILILEKKNQLLGGKLIFMSSLILGERRMLGWFVLVGTAFFVSGLAFRFTQYFIQRIPLFKGFMVSYTMWYWNWELSFHQ